MLRKLQQSTHFILTFLFVELIALLLGVLSLLVIHGLEERLAKLDNEDLPLIFAISEASREQLDQTMRIKEVLLFAQTDDREHFESANEKFVHAGRRLTNVIVEAGHITQNGLESTTSKAEKQQLEQVKAVLNEIQTSHNDYEHVCGSIARNLYKYRFLTKASIITGNENQTLEEAEKDYLSTLQKNISSLDDESKRLEDRLKDAFQITKDMTRDLAIQAARQRNYAWSFFLVIMSIFTVGGIFLLSSIYRIQLERSREKADRMQKLATPFRTKTDFLLGTTEQMHNALNHMGTNINRQEVAIKAVVNALNSLDRLASGNAQHTTESAHLAQENARKTSQAERSIQGLQNLSTRTIGFCDQVHKDLSRLLNMVMQVDLLATSASAEAARKEASQGFVIFTNEIKERAQQTATTINEIKNIVDKTRQEINHSNKEVENSQQIFDAVIETNQRLITGANHVQAASQEQSSLVGNLKEETGVFRDMLVDNNRSLQDSTNACQTLRSQTTDVTTMLQDLVTLVDSLRSTEYKPLTEADKTPEPPPPKATELAKVTDATALTKVTDAVATSSPDETRKVEKNAGTK